MNLYENCFFRLYWGAHPVGGYEFRIDIDGDKRIAKYRYFLKGAEWAKEVSESEMRSFEIFLFEIGVQDWFSSYEQRDLMMFDGYRWELYYQGRESHGSNAYPEGFSGLINYLAGHFNCENLLVDQEFLPFEGVDENPFNHIADYIYRVGDPKEDERRLREGFWTEEELNEHNEEVVEQLMNDLSQLASREPRFQNYNQIIDSSGLRESRGGLSPFREIDIDELDADTILALMMFVYRADHHHGDTNGLIQCVEDGIFKKWITRLNEIANLQPRI